MARALNAALSQVDTAVSGGPYADRDGGRGCLECEARPVSICGVLDAIMADYGLSGSERVTQKSGPVPERTCRWSREKSDRIRSPLVNPYTLALESRKLLSVVTGAQIGDCRRISCTAARDCFRQLLEGAFVPWQRHRHQHARDIARSVPFIVRDPPGRRNRYVPGVARKRSFRPASRIGLPARRTVPPARGNIGSLGATALGSQSNPLRTEPSR